MIEALADAYVFTANVLTSSDATRQLPISVEFPEQSEIFDEVSF